MSAIRVSDLWKFYGDLPALRGIDLEVSAGTCVALVGRNGAGKTTLLRVLAGLTRAGRGRVEVLGASPNQASVRRKIGVLGHGLGLYEELSAWENLVWFGRVYGVPQAEERARYWLARTGLEAVRHGRVREFSRGMRQRLALVRVLLHDPELLLLDEPFTALDDRAISLLQQVLRERLQQGSTILMSTHQLREAMELATHVALLHRGRLVHYGERTPEMAADPASLYERYARD